MVGDIGGTNARFAWIEHEGAGLSHNDVLAASAYPSLLDAMRDYLCRQALPTPRWCALGIANPVVGDEVKMTNHDWSFSIAALQRALGVTRLLVINDFTALALSLPALTPAELRQVGTGQAQLGGPVALLGPGTGLGVSGLLRGEAGRPPVPVKGEGGHVTLPACDETEERVVTILRRRFGHASAERALSGPGIANLHAAACELAGEPPIPIDAAEVTTRALAGSDPRSTEAVDWFFSFLGTVAGDLVLSLGALGGVYIGGGIVPRLGLAIEASAFRERFESKGRFRAYMERVPSFVIEASTSPALLGAARALDEL